jgi:hypothetical protein
VLPTAGQKGEAGHGQHEEPSNYFKMF